MGRIRKELENIGWWRSERKSGPGGIFVWEHIFQLFTVSTIPQKSIHGESMVSKTMHGSSIYGEPGDITTGEHQKKNNQKENNNRNGVAVVSSSSRKRITPRAPLPGGKEMDSSREGLERRLVVFGFNSEDAQILLKKYPLGDLEAWCRVGGGKNNPAGFIKRALEKGWKLPPEVRMGPPDPPDIEDAESPEQKQYKIHLEAWKELPYEVKRRYLSDGKLGSCGSNLNFPDPDWLSQVITLESKRKKEN